ncbi:MAG: HEPN domain-containing protein [Candidatus Binatia bacterium]
MRPITREWIEKAEEDYRVARRERDAQPPVYTAVCFHAQQCAEKYLKAVLQEQEHPFYRTHDLEALMKLCLSVIPELENYRERLQWLTVFAVEARYPGMAARRQDAERCFQIAKSLRTRLRRHFGVIPRRGRR